jgi:hypothetical protein
LQIAYPVENPTFQGWRENDIQDCPKMEKEMAEFEEKRDVSKIIII